VVFYFRGQIGSSSNNNNDTSAEISFEDQSMDRTVNMENITLVWYDVNINTIVEDTNESRNSLRDINDYVVNYHEQDECLNYIQSIQNENIFLITSGSCALAFVPLVHELKQIDSIFIFCREPIKYQHLLNQYQKIIGIYTEQQQLTHSIKEQVELLEEQVQTFRFYDQQQQQKSTRHLSEESAGFLWFQLFKDVIIQMPTGNEDAKKQMIQTCKKYYRGNKRQLDSIEEFDKTYQPPRDSIKWYTAGTFVYKLINKALRTENVEQLYIFRFFIIDLCNELQNEWEKLKSLRYHQTTYQLYRGGRLSQDELEKLKRSEGQLISTNGFLSTSRRKQVALIFAGTSGTDAIRQSVIYEIEYNLNELKSVVVADISSYSRMPDEEEVLFDLSATFKLLSISRDETNLLWIIRMKATDEGREAAQNYSKLNQQDIDETSVSVVLGELFLKMGQYDKAQLYFKNLIKQKKELENVAWIYNIMGDLCRRQGNYDQGLKYYKLSYEKIPRRRQRQTARILSGWGIIYYELAEYNKALENFQKALKITQKYYGHDHKNNAQDLNNIGLVYHEKQEYNLALDFLMKALKVAKKSPSDPVYVASCLVNIARVYRRKKDFDLALKYYLESLKILEEHVGHEHSDIGLIIDNMSELYNEMGEHDYALEKALKGLDIRQKSLPNDHPDIGRSYTNIGWCYQNKQNYHQAIEYYEKALDNYKKTLPPDHPDCLNTQQNLDAVKNIL
jgi:tetratricopeptide (TPR) repeat protein